MDNNCWLFLDIISFTPIGWFLSDIIQDTNMPRWLQIFTLDAIFVIYCMIIWNILMRFGLVTPY